MGRSIRIIHVRDFVCVEPDGHLDLEESERLLRDVVSVSSGLEAFDILVDTRDAQSTLSASDLWYLADCLSQHPATFNGRTAILCPFDRFDHANFFALRAESQGVEMQAFTSYEEAMKWLTADR